MNTSEWRLYRLLRGLGTEVVPQARIGRFSVDFLLPELDVIVEADGAPYHTLPADARSDRLRDAELQSMGFMTIHVWTSDLLNGSGRARARRRILVRLYRERGIRFEHAARLYQRLDRGLRRPRGSGETFTPT